MAVPTKRITIDRKRVLEAIRRAARKLGRPPKRAELPRVAGISYTALLTHFSSIREALRAAGLEPPQKGLKIPEEALLADWLRVRDQLGKVPDRHDYTQYGRYAITTFCGRFGGWTRVPGLAERLEARAAGQPEAKPLSVVETGNAGEILAPAPLLPSGEADEGDKATAMQWTAMAPALPDLAGKRRVTDAFCAMVVNTLMGDEAGRKWRQVMMGEAPEGDDCQNRRECQTLKSENVTLGRAAHGGNVSAACVAVNGHSARGLARLNGSITSGGVIDGERPIMGPPFDRSVLTNAPMNEYGVIFLFGMVAGELGFQVESLRGDFPDCEARRQIQPGKWQRVRIEFEYESRNFSHHGHDSAECDVIVCWKHNWVRKPASLEIIELSKILQSAK